MQIIVKNMKFGMFCVTAYVYMGQGYDHVVLLLVLLGT
jgi:hypothetical protein